MASPTPPLQRGRVMEALCRSKPILYLVGDYLRLSRNMLDCSVLISAVGDYTGLSGTIHGCWGLSSVVGDYSGLSGLTSVVKKLSSVVGDYPSPSETILDFSGVVGFSVCCTKNPHLSCKNNS